MISLKKWDMVLRNLVTKGATMEEVEIAYQGKFDKLFAHLKKNIASGDSLSVVFGAADEANTGEKGKKKPYQYARLWLSNPGPNPKWVYIRCDNEYNLDNAFHIELSWIACDSWLLDDWVNKLFRRCSSYNLRLVQLPEFFYSSNIQLHSFRAQPFIPIPRSYRGQSSADDDLAAALVVERIYLRQNSLDWIEDNEQYTDWKSVDVPIPLNHYELHHRKHLNLDLNGTPLSSVTDLETILEMQTSSITPPSTPLPAPAVSALTESLAKAKERKESEPEPLQALKLPANSVDGDGLQTATRSHIKERPVPQKDRQYILRLGNGGVRVGNNGFVWLLNAAAKTNDIPAVTSGATTSNSAAPAMITSDEKKDMGLAKLMEFHILCTDVGICLDLLMETIDSAWATIVERASSRVQQKQSILNQMH